MVKTFVSVILLTLSIVGRSQDLLFEHFKLSTAPLILSIDTDLGDGNYFKLPTRDIGSYDCVVDWGDLNTSEITSWDDPDTTHYYSLGGEYIVKIYGTFTHIYFNNTGDKDKLTGIESFGETGLINTANGFWGCTNAAGAIPAFPSTLSVLYDNSFRGAKFTSVDFTGISQIRGTLFYFCSDTLDIITIPSETTSVFGGSHFANSQVRGLVWNSPQTTLPGSFFQGTYVKGDIVINTNITYINSFCFASCTVTGDMYLTNTPTAPPVNTGGLGMSLTGVIHVPIGATGYDIEPWTSFTIVYDL